jgi:hypothetical protein
MSNAQRYFYDDDYPWLILMTIESVLLILMGILSKKLADLC